MLNEIPVIAQVLLLRSNLDVNRIYKNGLSLFHYTKKDNEHKNNWLDIMQKLIHHYPKININIQTTNRKIYPCIKQ